MKDISADSATGPAKEQQAPPKPSVDRIGNYRILEEIGSGGMAVVYKGIQESLGRVVAIKALKTSLTFDENIVARFEREALSLASFQHENIITLYDFFRDRGALCMVMEFVEGIDLYDLLERCERVPYDTAAIMALQVARALDYAHFRGVIHRDVKPANVIISQLGEVKLSDFGIARTEHSDLTEAGIGLGTPAYMSPEQIVGDKLDHRTDIWALGVVLYQMITGRKPFIDDEDRSAMQRIRLDEPVLPRQIEERCPKELEWIVLKCMQKAPADRYGSTQELVTTLEQFLASHVRTNYRARLVIYLKEQNVISEDETSAMLHPALIGEYSSHATKVTRTRPRSRGRRLGAMVLGLLALGAGAGAAAGWLAHERLQDPSVQKIPAKVCPASAELDKKRGYLHVLAHPWARVEVDGSVLGTTPFAEPLALPPGKHTVVLTNPYFEPVKRTVTIARGEVLRIVEVLKRSGAGPDLKKKSR